MTVGLVISPATFDGSANSISATATGFTGAITGDAATGQLTVTNAGPPGDYTVDVTAPHNCGFYSTNTSFVLRVNQAPSLTAGSPSVQQGRPATTATLGTVSDLETAAGSLSVTTVSVPSGVTVGTINNSNGTITAPLSASCTAVTGPRTLTLRVTDGDGASTDVDVTVNVTANASPTLGVYAATEVKAGESINVTPDGAPATTARSP